MLFQYVFLFIFQNEKIVGEEAFQHFYIKMKKILFSLLLFLLCFDLYSQSDNSLVLQMGVNSGLSVIKPNPLFFSGFDAIEHGTNLLFTARTNIESSSRLAISYGLGFSRRIIDFYPLVSSNNIPALYTMGQDSLLVAELTYKTWQLMLPLGLSYKLLEFPFLFHTKCELRYCLETIYSINIKEDITDVGFGYDIDSNPNDGWIPVCPEQKLVEKTTAYYNSFLRGYDLRCSTGFELADKISANTQIKLGFNYSKYLLAPIKNQISDSYKLECNFGVIHLL